MFIVKALLLVTETLVALLLLLVILVQKSKGQGLGLAFGGGMGESLFGSRAGNVLTKMTIVLGSVFVANTLVLAMLYTTGGAQPLMEKAAPAPMPVEAPAPVPAAPAPLAVP